MSNTGEQCPLGMNSLDVCLEVVALGGAIVTVGAGIRLLTSVDPLVPSQICAVTSLVTALITKQPQPLSITLHQRLLWLTVPRDKLACRVPCPADNPRLREKNRPSCSLGSFSTVRISFLQP